MMALSADGRREEAVSMLNGPLAELAARLKGVSSEWIQHNEDLATTAGKAAVLSHRGSPPQMLVANCSALLVTGLLGILTFRRIVHPIRALETR